MFLFLNIGYRHKFLIDGALDLKHLNLSRVSGQKSDEPRRRRPRRAFSAQSTPIKKVYSSS